MSLFSAIYKLITILSTRVYVLIVCQISCKIAFRFFIETFIIYDFPFFSLTFSVPYDVTPYLSSFVPCGSTPLLVWSYIDYRICCFHGNWIDNRGLILILLIQWFTEEKDLNLNLNAINDNFELLLKLISQLCFFIRENYSNKCFWNYVFLLKWILMKCKMCGSGWF